MIENLILIILLSVIVEYLVNVIKPLIPEADYPIPLVISLVIGIALAVVVKADILTAVGFNPEYLIISYIVTGLIVSGGSTAVHELVAKLRASRQDIQNKI